MGVSQIQFKPLKGTTSTPVSFIGKYPPPPPPGADARFEDHHATCCNVPLLYILYITDIIVSLFTQVFSLIN